MTPDSVTTVTIDFWQLLVAIAIVVVFIGSLMMLTGKMLLGQLDARSGEREETRREEQRLRDEALKLRLDGHEEELASVNHKADQIERDVRQLASMLPNEYVRREDWIRFSGTIDTKLDWLREKQDDMRQSVTQLGERLKGFVGGNNER